MFNNYLKTTVRNLWKNKTYSFLNIFGFAVGIACAGLIFLWVEDEVKFDSSNVKKENIYLVKTNSTLDAGVMTHSSTPGVLGPAIHADVPGIANTCRVSEGPTSLLFTIGDKPLYASGRYAEPSLFSIFTLPFVEGNATNAFTQLYSLVITEKTAKKFFGEAKNAVGKTVLVNNKQNYVITGVLKDLPQNSTLNFEWLAPFEIYYQQSPWAQKWENTCLTTYVELQPQASLATVNKQLYGYLQTKLPGTNSHFFLFGMKDWHLYDQFANGVQTGGGRIEFVRLFTVIAWIILFIACINFMNLATARSEKRAKEVGVRKVLGAGKKKLVAQFMGEAIFMALLAAFVAILLMSLTLPAFNKLVEKDLELALQNPVHIAALLLITSICGLIAGSYPSLYLSSFNPVFVLKGIKLKTGSAALIRKGLVIMQFSVSIILIIGTIIIYQQIQHAKSRNLGLNKDNLLQMSLHGDMLKNFTSIKQDLLNTGVIENAALADHETIYDGNNTTNITWQGKDPNSMIVISQRLVSPEFIATADMKVSEGRDFQETDIMQMTDDFKPKDPSQPINVIVTESMADLLGKGSAIGKTLRLPLSNDNDFTLHVVGVIKNYMYGYMYGTPAPVILYCIPQVTSLMYVRIKKDVPTEQALAKIGAVMKKDNPSFPFEYKFVDDQFNNMFLAEMLISKLSRVFAALAIIISCLGLFGLAAYIAERRTKEIGIRKVLGASVPGLTGLISKGFIQMVLVSCVVAFPVSWLIMNKWLEGFPYRITISWWIFIVAGLMAMFIALATISVQAIKAALSNPIKNLRTE